MQISSQFRKPNSSLKHTHPKYITVRADGMHKAGGGLITLIRGNITFTTTDIPSTINTHNKDFQMVKVHINNIKHIRIANIYIPLRDSTFMQYKTANTDIQHHIQYITNIPHSVLTGDMNSHSTLWNSYTDDHREQLIADVISRLTHQPECRTPHYNKHHHQISPRCLTHCITTTKTRDFHQLQESCLDTFHGKRRGCFRSDHHTHKHTHCQHNVYKHHTDGIQAQHIKGKHA